MKLEPDCVRAVLLAVEALDYGEHTNPERLHQVLPEYSEEQLEYTCLMLGDGDFLDLLTVDMMGQYTPGIKAVVSLTYKGHEFLDKIRDDGRWEAVKSAGTAVRNYSLSAISSIAEGITKVAIDRYLSGTL